MTLQILLNLVIGMVWMLLHDEWNMLTFTIGYLIGMIFIFALRRFFPGRFYGIKIWSIIKLLLLFNIELVKSSLVVIGQITRPKLNIQPGIFKLETKLKSDWEIIMLTNMLALTPGSAVLEIAPKEGIMYIHAMDVAEFKQSIVRTKDLFEEAIIEVMR
ncbi:Na+/H+ antiporter subunit E [Paenibacillus pinihumi]|uniref:Na+/H+ antiporter subunit E n=1 Tax=Paenibacillus pinihumi TaxID=669462 RepID=UPI00042A8F7D|nr:Na+/H+ antiporter subunit E [Paenibacillus pinihumi]